MIGGSTRVFALLGRPVAHSLSPAMHNAAFHALGLDAVYVALDCSAEAVGTLMRTLAEAGGGGNITIPHKSVAAAHLQGGPAAGSSACNTFWRDSGVLAGDNTDPDGVRQALARLGVTGSRWLILGTGGSARGCADAARRAGAAVAVRSRSPERASALLADVVERGGAIADETECDLLINATPLGLRPSDGSPVDLAQVPSVRAVLDLVYHAGETALVHAARARGCAAADGREVLLGQGLAAFARWFPGVEPPEELMRAAVHAALR